MLKVRLCRSFPYNAVEKDRELDEVISAVVMNLTKPHGNHIATMSSMHHLQFE